jgi:predicted RNase H-like HicB family nuclease
MRYTAIVEKTTSNYSAYVPDLPGCIATGMSIEEVLSQIQSAISFHV